MNPEVVIRLNRFVPRDYQLPICSAFENSALNKFLYVLPRRSGKDTIAWNLMIREAIKKTGIYYYCLPEYKLARSVIWDGMTNEGFRMLDFIPPQLFAKKPNEQQMKITLLNGSIIQLIGSDSYDSSITGTNTRMFVFSEYGKADPMAYKQGALPILRGNNGKVIIIGTPRGHNHFYELYQIAKNSPQDWFCYYKTIEDTNHIPIADIRRDIELGEMSEDLALQEYWCSWDLGIEGAYYTKYIDRMRIAGQIGMVPWEPSFKVHTAWDLGVRDSTCVIFYQVIGKTIRIIDSYEKNKEGFEHYAQMIHSKPYIYGKHFAPHDIMVTEWGTGLSRLEKARELGIKFETRADENGTRHSAVPNLLIMDGIEAVRTTLPKMWIDENKCGKLIKSLENYRQEYDTKLRIYKPRPLHDFYSHFADAMRYLCLSYEQTIEGMTYNDIQKIKEKAYGSIQQLPRMFRDDLY